MSGTSTAHSHFTRLVLMGIVLVVVGLAVWAMLPAAKLPVHTRPATEKQGKLRANAFADAQSLYLGGNTLEADAAFQRVIHDPDSTAEQRREALFARGKLAKAKSSHDEALNFFCAASELVTEKMTPVVWTDIQTEVALQMIQLNRSLEALPLLRKIVQLREKLLDPLDPKLITSLETLFDQVVSYDDMQETLSVATRIIQKTEAISGPNHTQLIQKLDRLASSLRSSNHCKEAASFMAEKLARLEAAQTPNQEEILRSLCFIENTLEEANQFDAAEPYARRIFTQTAQKSGNIPAIKIDNILFLGKFLQKAGKSSEAELLFQEAYEDQILHTESGGPPSVTEDLAQVFADLGRLTEAETLYRISVQYHKKSPSNAPGSWANCLSKLTEILDATNHLPEAEPLLRESAKLYMQHQSLYASRSSEAVASTSNYLRAARELQVSDEEIYQRLEAERSKTNLGKERFDELWKEALAKNPRESGIEQSETTK